MLVGEITKIGYLLLGICLLMENYIYFSSHDRFKQCVQRETRRLCDRGVVDGPATRFATQIIDKALNFLQDQCLNYMYVRISSPEIGFKPLF